MKSTIRRIATLLVLFYGLSLFGCATFQRPKKLIENVDYIGDQYVRYLSDSTTVFGSKSSSSKSKSGSDSKNTGQLFDLSVEVCDLTEQRNRTNCQTSPVLETATLSDSYTATKGIRVNQITNLFWYDSQTLFVSYMREPGMQTGADDAVSAATGIKTGSKPSFKPHVRRCHLDKENNLDCKEARNLNNALFIKKRE